MGDNKEDDFPDLFNL